MQLRKPLNGTILSRRSKLSLMLSCSLLSACANTPWMKGAEPLDSDRERNPTPAKLDAENKAADQGRFYQTPTVPAQAQGKPPKVAQPQNLPDEPGKVATVVFNGMPLPQFIDSVFGVVLKRTIAIDPVVQQRRDLVSMRADKPQTPSQLFESAKTVLRAYGIVVQELPGLVRFVPDTADPGSLPEIRRGRALPEVPEALRPQFHIVELENTNVNNMSTFVRTTFVGKVSVQEDLTRNAIILSGSPANVSAAMQAVIALDQPLMRGKNSARIVPVYWSAEELAKRLNDIMASEGYYSGSQPASQSPIILLPVGPINSIIVFANNQATLDHVLQWAEELDQPTEVRNSNYFIYPVRNADANEIAATLSQVMGGGAAPVAAGAAASASGKAPSKVVVDKATNSIIMQASSSEYQQWYGLLKELDKPAKSALISVSVAEVTLDDNEDFGFEWLLNKLKVGNYTGTIGTQGNLEVAKIGGLALSLGNASATMLLNALASTTKTRLLSNPSLMTRSGEDATITVGDEVPTITSNQTTGNTVTTGTATTNNIIQTIQYRNTGVILKVRPVVRNGGRIDLNIAQEVSSAKTIVAGQVQSPTISTRKIETKLTAIDGNTIVLGGLITDNRSSSDSGIPYAKDIPILGNLFKKGNESTKRNELIVLITAYAMEDEYDTQAVADAVRKRFPWANPLISTKALGKQEVSEVGSQENVARRLARPYAPKASEAPNGIQASSSAQAAPASVSDLPQASPIAPVVSSDQQKSPSPSPPKSTAAGAPITDEALKKELLEALKIK